MFFEVLTAINDPNRQGNVDQLSQVTGSLQQLATAQGLSDDKMGAVMSALGGALQPALKQRSSQPGGDQLTALLNQAMGSQGQLNGLQSLISPSMQQQLATAIAQKTGLNASVVQSMMPQLLNAVMGMFKMGASKPGVSTTGDNPLLSAFLESQGGGSTDMANTMKFAARFLNAPQ